MINLIKSIIRTAFGSLFSSDLDVMSKEVREILSNPDDAEIYKNGLDRIENGEDNVTLTFSTGKTITLIQTRKSKSLN